MPGFVFLHRAVHSPPHFPLSIAILACDLKIAKLSGAVGSEDEYGTPNEGEVALYQISSGRTSNLIFRVFMT